MTILIILITGIISYVAMRNPSMQSKLQFNAYQIVHRHEYYRLLTHGFIHGGWSHLLVNMFVLYFFGRSAEYYLQSLAAAGLLKFPSLVYLVFYLAALIVASSVSLIKQKDNVWYNAVGASGAVAAILFLCIFFDPWQPVYFYGIIRVPGIIFGALYLVYSQVMIRRGGDNIAHEAHFMGAVFGFIFPLFIDLGLFKDFLGNLFSIMG